MKRYDRTDAGNAELFAELYAGKVLFDHRQQRWLIWDEKECRWMEDKTKTIQELMKQATSERLRRSFKFPRETEAERAELNREVKFANDSQNHYKIIASLESAKTVAGISDSGDAWDSNPWAFGVANGIVDLRSGTFRKRTPTDRITKFSPVVFDASAKCPRFEQFLLELFGEDNELIRYVQKAVGYSLSGSVQEQCLFACYGKGSNGKSTLLEIILHLMGDYGIDLPFSVLEAKNYGSAPGEGVNLPGARFAKVVEIREGRRLDEARVKSWTGGDTITVRPLYRNSFSFQPTHKLWLAFNHKPDIGDDSKAMWRRIRLIPFTSTFEARKAEKGLLDKLKGEASGILNWAIGGCLAWQAEGLNTPQAVTQATNEYESESDALAPFLEDRCELGANFRVTKGALWEAYKDWCAANKETPLSRKPFAEKMKDKKFGDGSTGSARYWTGIGLNAPDTTDTTEADLPKFSIESSL